MSVTSGHVRPEQPDTPPEQPPGGDHDLFQPPEVPKKTAVPMIQFLMPVMMVLMMVGMVVAMLTLGGGMGGRIPYYMMMFPMMMIIGVATMASHTVGGGNQIGEVTEDRKEFLSYLGVQRRRAHATGRKQHAARSWGNPEPAVLPSLVGTTRMWERLPSASTFGHVRVGLGTERLAQKLKSPESAPVDDLEPVTARFLKRFMDTHKTQTGIPLAIALRTYPFISLSDGGDGEDAAALTRSMVCELTLFHGPDHVLVAVITDDPDAPRWGWVKWLPHNQHPDMTDQLGTARMVYRDVGSARTALGSMLRHRKAHNKDHTEAMPHVVIISDRVNVTPAADLIGRDGTEGVTLIDLQPGESTDYLLSDSYKAPFELNIIDGLLYAPNEKRQQTKFAAPDRVSLQFAESFARMLARYRPASEMDIIERQVHRKMAEADLAAHLGFRDAATADPRVLQKRNVELRDFLKVPLGVSKADQVIYIDFKEIAQGGTGPHGVMIGSTGSGKSELLRTLVLALLLTHRSDRLNMLLIDYKGGAAFLGFDKSPHVSAILTNMEEEAHLVERMEVAIRGEFNRRQEIFRRTAERPDVHTAVNNITVYNELRDSGVPLEPLPALFIVVDEFSALMAEHKDFAKLFAFIGQQGRSMGVFMLLASQELAEGQMHRIETHLSYRIALRVNDKRVSMDVLGTSDAYEMSGGIGSAILKNSAGDFIDFRAYYTGKAYVPPKRSAPVINAGPEQVAPDAPQPRLFTAAALEAATGPNTPVPGAGLPAGGDGAALPALGSHTAQLNGANGEAAASESAQVVGVNTKTVALVLLDRLHGHGMPAHRIWLPPLDTSFTLGEMLNDPDLYWPKSQRGPLRIPVGVIDTPYYQRRDALIVDLMADNALVVGAGQSGLSTMMQTLIMSAAALHSSNDVQFYCLDFSSGKLRGLSELAHVGSVATRNNKELVSRTIAELTAIWHRRAKLFIDNDINDMAEFRTRKAQGDPALRSDTHGDIVLVVDGWTTIGSDESAGFEHLENKINLLVGKAKSFGIHVVLTSNRWADFKPKLKDLFGIKLELRLNDTENSEVHRKKAETVPGKPGRGIIRSTRPRSGDTYNPEVLDLLIALPIVEPMQSHPLSTNVPVDLRGSVRTINESNPKKAVPIRLLGNDIPRHAFMASIPPEAPPPGRAALRVPIGLGEDEMQPRYVDFNDDTSAHFAIIGEKGKGKTSLLRHVVTTLCERNEPGQSGRGVFCLVVDFRRRLYGVLPPGAGYGSYCTNDDELRIAIENLQRMLEPRRPSSQTSLAQLRRRDWWSGPDIFVIVDNAHDFASRGQFDDPLQQLKPYMAIGRDIGFHVVASWLSGQVSNQIYGKTLLAELKKLQVPGIMMSVPREENVLLHEVRGAGDQGCPGRGTFASSTSDVELVQVPYLPQPNDDEL